MINILKVQNDLKNLSDEQLAQEMRMPSGTAPQYLVMTEMQRRQKMRSEFSGQQPPQTTMADEMSGAAPEQPQMGAPQGGPPQGGQEQMPPTAMMAAGGSVFAGSGPATGMSSPQFGNLFGAPAPTARPGGVDPTTGYAPITEAPYVAPPAPVATNPYQAFIDSMRGHKGNPNPRVHQNTAPPGLNLPKGMAAPAPGTQGLGMRYANSNERAKPQYYWKSPEARDAYVRYMTPPAKPAAPVTKAGGGPIRMGGGMEVEAPYAPPPLRPYVDPNKYIFMSDDELQKAASGTDPVERENANFYLKNRNSQSRFMRGMDATARGVANVGSAAGEVIKKYGPYAIPGAAPMWAAYQYGPQAYDYLMSPGERLAPGYESERGHGRDVGLTPVDTGASSLPPAAAVIGATAPKKKSAGSAAVSGAPEGGPGGLAALRAQQTQQTQQTQPTVQSRTDGGSEYEKQANALLDQLRGDKESDKNRDINNALMQFGLSMAGSKNPNLLSAIAEGGLPALQKYNETREGRRKEDRGLTADQLAILGKKTEISAAEAKAAQDAEQARWEREQKFPEEQRLREAQIRASEASANRNTELETLQAALKDPALADLMLKMKTVGSVGRNYTSQINAIRAAMAKEYSAPAKAKLQAQLDDLLRRQAYAMANGYEEEPAGSGTDPNYNLGGKQLIPIN